MKSINSSSEVISLISTIYFMIENFPDNIVGASKQKYYGNIFDFIIDVCKSLGKTPKDIIYLILDIILMPKREGIRDKFELDLEKLDELDDKLDSPWIKTMDKILKGVIATNLSLLYSCSADPILSDKFMDPHIWANNKGPNKKESITREGGFDIPISSIDPFGFLEYCPVSYAGRFVYDDCEHLGINDLYKTNDFNAFIWYTLNASNSFPQQEVNKCMWDNRNEALYSRKQEDWNAWINSKTCKFFNPYSKDMKHEPGSLYVEGNKDIHPIIQLGVTRGNEGTMLKVQSSSQEYYKSRRIFNKNNPDKFSLGFNKTLFEFNYDYLNSIKIFSFKPILFSLYNLLSGSLDSINGLSINTLYNRELLKIPFDKIIESLDSDVDDCYYTFSNEELDEMLDIFEMKQFDVRKINTATSTVYPIDREKNEKAIKDLIDLTDDKNSSLNEISNKMKGTVSQVVTIDRSFNESTSNELTYNSTEGLWTGENFKDFLKNVLEVLAIPIFSPQIRLLLAINFEIQGYDLRFSLARALAGIITNFIVLILKTILEEILRRISEWVMPIITSYASIRLMELLEEYEELLVDALTTYAPYAIDSAFGIANFFTHDGTIDDVSGAEITTEKKTPDSKKNC